MVLRVINTFYFCWIGGSYYLKFLLLRGIWHCVDYGDINGVGTVRSKMETEMIAAQLLYKNNTNVNFDIAAKLLIRLANNVLENPLEMKYRRLRVGNPIIESKLLPLVGAMECLFEMGFKEVRHI